MVGPVFHMEMVRGQRRFHFLALRWIYAIWLGILIIWFLLEFLVMSGRGGTGMPGPSGSSSWGQSLNSISSRFVEFFLWQQALFLFLAVPLFTTGAIIDEKVRGSLAPLILTDLEPRHILLGKLLARATQSVSWLLMGWPLLGFFGGIAGLEPWRILGLLLSLLFPLFGVSCLSLLASVYFSKVRDALFVIYILLAAGAVGIYLRWPFFEYLNPLYLLQVGPTESMVLPGPATLTYLLGAGAIWLVLGSLFLVAAILWLPSMGLAENLAFSTTAANKSRPDHVFRGEDPVFWREYHIEGLTVVRGLKRMPRWVGVMLMVVAGVVVSFSIWASSLASTGGWNEHVAALVGADFNRLESFHPGAAEWFFYVGLVVMFLSSLAVGVRCAESFSLERERQTLEALLLTPLSARQIVHAKLSAVMRAGYWYLAGWGVPTLLFSFLSGPSAFLITVFSLMGSVLAAYYLGAAGLWFSIRARSSWKSFLQTMITGYLGGLALYLILSPAVVVFFLLLMIFLAVLDLSLQTGLAKLCLNNGTYTFRLFILATELFFVLTFWLLAKWFLHSTVRWIADRERTRFQIAEITRGRRPVPRRTTRPAGKNYKDL